MNLSNQNQANFIDTIVGGDVTNCYQLDYELSYIELASRVSMLFHSFLIKDLTKVVARFSL